MNVLGGKMEKDIIILACSAKHSGYCVAGIDLSTDDWIRLVASKNLNTNEIPKSFMLYSDFTTCKPLDVVTVDILEELPGDIQPENALINLNRKPVLKYRVTPNQLENYISNDLYIYKGVTSYMNQSTALSCGYSLRLFKVQDIYLNVFECDRRMKSKLNFKYNGLSYEGWSMTDPSFYRCNSGKICNEGLIVVSIPEDGYNGNYYKFVSKIIRL